MLENKIGTNPDKMTRNWETATYGLTALMLLSD